MDNRQKQSISRRAVAFSITAKLGNHTQSANSLWCFVVLYDTPQTHHSAHHYGSTTVQSLIHTQLIWHSVLTGKVIQAIVFKVDCIHQILWVFSQSEHNGSSRCAKAIVNVHPRSSTSIALIVLNFLHLHVKWIYVKKSRHNHTWGQYRLGNKEEV